MIPALLHGKLSRDQENMEDVLTSSVFGLMRYLTPQSALLPWLARSESTESMSGGQSFPLRLLGELGTDVPIDVQYEFWPYKRGTMWSICEPDVVIRVKISPTRKLIILIEAKYRSGKSSIADCETEDGEYEVGQESEKAIEDQLAREWDNLVKVATSEGAEPHLIYLTAGFAASRNAIKSSIADYDVSNHKYETKVPRIYSLLWREVYEVIAFNSISTTGHETLIAHDLLALMLRLKLTFFHGFREISPGNIPTIEWTFTR